MSEDMSSRQSCHSIIIHWNLAVEDIMQVALGTEETRRRALSFCLQLLWVCVGVCGCMCVWVCLVCLQWVPYHWHSEITIRQPGLLLDFHRLWWECHPVTKFSDIFPVSFFLEAKVHNYRVKGLKSTIMEVDLVTWAGVWRSRRPR